MPTDPLKIAIKGSTQDHLPLEDVVDGIAIEKDGSCSMVMKISSVNFDLLSDREKMSLVSAYGGILNSLNFPIQIVIKSSTKDVGSYLERLLIAEQKQTSPLLKDRIKSYRKFIEETVKKNDVLSKSFYIVIKFSSIQLGLKSAGRQTLRDVFKSKRNINVALPYPREYILEKAKADLEPKKDHLVRLFLRLGLDIKPLNNKELVELYYTIYNENVVENQKIQTVDYTSPIVTTK